MMHRALPLAALAVATPLFAQPLPKATAAPPPVSEEQQVLAPIDAIFQAFERGDAAAVLANAYPDGRVTAVGDSVRQQSFAEFAKRITPEHRFQERITDPAVEIDGDMAMVWAPYTVTVDGKPGNCGVDLFDLVRENGRWKVMNVTFSSHTVDCAAR